ALARIRMALGAVDRAGRHVDERAHRLDRGAHGHQHAAHVGMADDRHGLAVAAGGPALHAAPGIGASLLIGALGDRQALDPDAEARGVHHGEHALDAAVFLADEVADRALLVAIGKHAGRARVDAELVLQRYATNVVARPELSVGPDQIFG